VELNPYFPYIFMAFTGITIPLFTKVKCATLVKGKGKGKVTLGHATKAQRWSIDITLLGDRWGWVVSATPRPLYLRKRPGTLCIETGWAPGPVWTGAENLAPTGILSPDRPARRESLY
jgi:hypothetical protein